jgi:exonuclease SbcC
MRPLKLTLQGFTSFRERAEVDFTDLDLFAITGPTGAGKTSILDAITWALYGKTPRLGKCSAELISHGKNSVAVNFEFAVGVDRYRIARTARHKGASQVRLEKLRDSQWIPEDAAGVKDTGAAICKLVGLDFDAFKLSVILPQGEFDQFLRGDHSERRKILKSLLGLERYDRMREMAHDRCRDLSAKEDAVREQVEHYFADATEEQMKSVKAELRRQKQAGEEAAARLDAAQKLCSLAEEIDRNRTSRASREARQSTAQSEYLKACDEEARKAEEAKGLRLQLETVQREHDGILIDEQRVSELIHLKIGVDQLDRLVVQRDTTRKTLADTQGELNAEKSEHEKSRKDLTLAEETYRSAQHFRAESQKAVDELAAGGSADLLGRMRAELETLPAKQRDANSMDEQVATAKRKEAGLRKLLADLGPQREAAEAALAQAREHEQDLTRHAVHRELRAGLKQGQPCPVCEQTVSVLPKIPAAGEIDAAQRRVKECELKLQEIRDAATRAETELAGIPGLVQHLESQRKRIEADVAGIRQRVHAVTGNLSDEACAQVLSSKIDAIRLAEKQLKQAIEKEADALNAAREAGKRAAHLDKAVTELAAKAAAAEQALTRLAEEIGRLQPGIDKAGGAARIVAELEQIEAERKRKAQLDEKVRKLQSSIAEAAQKRAEAETNAAVLGERARSLRAEVDNLTAALGELERQWAAAVAGLDLPEGGTEKQRAARWRDLAQQATQAIQQGIADLKAKIAAIKVNIERRVELERQIRELHSEWELYDQIHSALRADRFMDHLLGRAYDDLCRRGSEHLLRLSGERYSFTAGKNTFNVKDGWNGDAERPAGTLSGGESFFASLALALALAESVSSFSADGSQAARLEALFLDEGVSTLDQDEALPAVVDALMHLQAGDRMIGVISHMENLAQRLPARIEIVKNHGHSTVRIGGYASDAQPLSGII